MPRVQVLQLWASTEQRQRIDQAAAAEGISRTEFIPRSCQEQARAVLFVRTLCPLTPAVLSHHVARIGHMGAEGQRVGPEVAVGGEA